MEMDEEIRFEVRDRLGRLVRLREEVYQRHLPEHPEMSEYVEEAKQTIAGPDFELADEDESGNCYKYYRMGLGRDKFQKCFLMVPVYYRETLFWGEVGEVATFHFTRRVGRGNLTWKRN
jgi:hypothetical protein